MARTTTRLAAALALAGLAAGCSSSPEPQDVTVGLVDYGFEDLPSELAAGSTLTVDNRSDSELHELVAFRLDDDEQRSVEELVALPPEELGPLLGQPTIVQLQAPGSDEVVEAAGDGTLADPGRYAFLCFIPTGIEPSVYLEAAAQTEEGPPQVDGGGPPHFVNGMWAEVTVVS